MVNFYEQYQNRILKLAKFKRVLHKFRFLIIGLLALLIAGVSALLATKGLVTDGMSLSATEVYFNEEYEVTPAKAFLVSDGSQKIEYRLVKDVNGNPVDSGWTDVKPDLVGTYEVRTVLPKAIGVGYSDTMELRILPIEANITLGDTVRYGDKPTCTIPELVDGNVVSMEDLDFEYEDITKTETYVNVVKDSLKIVKNVNGELVDYTDCYNFTYENNTNFVPSPIKILRREITIIPVSMDFTYDGEKAEYVPDVTEETKLELADGDRLEITVKIYGSDGKDTTPVDVGTYSVAVGYDDFKIINSKNIDVTAHYTRLNASSLSTRGTITIAKREITITTKTLKKEYDGTALSDGTVICDNLVSGHTITSHGVPAVTDVTKNPKDNEFTCSISYTDEEGHSINVTDNYHITYDYGTLTITPFTVTYNTEGAEKV
ncbi:MAG: hypothetical protein K2N47_01570, partial [Clostridia bacterium]|nr:hypothetical protein [Clostridia bacterium]